MWTWVVGAAAIVWPLVASVLVPKVFPGLFSKLLLETVEQRNRKDLARYKDELDRSAALSLEQAKGEIIGSYATLKSSMDFLSAGQSGLRTHSVEAVETLWRMMLDLREAHAGLMYFERVFLVRERQDAIAGKDYPQILRSIVNYKNEAAVAARSDPFQAVEIERRRPFCGEKLWLIFVIYRSVYLRSAYLLGRALNLGIYTPLIDDVGIRQLMTAALPQDLLDRAQADECNGLASLIGQLEGEFLKEAARVMSGSKAVAESLADMQATQRLYTREVATAISEIGTAP
ncbi:MAG TPA: hypothetical protein VHZ26_02650 [Caulobacteraceae bacterium]|jgi:hypothetical protein|nr:hypothetical protein [Caulobacteraceae bacterium]